MKKKIALLTFFLIILCAFTSYAAAYSNCWKKGHDGIWRVYNAQGVLQKNTWFCDDAIGPQGANNWYLLDENGNMVSAPIVRDGTGNYYSLETRPIDTFGMIRYTSGNYDGINIVFNTTPGGSFGAIMNKDAIDALIAKYGLKDVSHINNSNCVYSSKIQSTTTYYQNSAEKDTGEYKLNFYVNGSKYKTKYSDSSTVAIISYGSNLEYWEDRSTGEIYYPGEYYRFTGSKRSATFDAVLAERKQTYTLKYYSDGKLYHTQTSSSGEFSVIADAYTTVPDLGFIGWRDSYGNIWNYGETYTAHSYSDKMTAEWNPFINDSGSDGSEGYYYDDDYYYGAYYDEYGW